MTLNLSKSIKTAVSHTFYLTFFWKHYYYDYDYDWNTIQQHRHITILLVNPHIPHWNSGTILVISIIVWKEDVLLPAMFSPLHSSTNQLKITSAVKVAPIKITNDFCFKWKRSCAYHKIDTFCSEQRTQMRALVSPSRCIVWTAVWKKAPQLKKSSH